MADVQQQAVGTVADVTTLTASEIAAQIRDGALSSQDAVEAHIQRIEAVNPRINAVVFPLFDQARAGPKMLTWHGPMGNQWDRCMACPSRSKINSW